MSEIAIHRRQDGSIEARLGPESVWRSLMRMSNLYGRDKSVVSRHLGNVCAEGEMSRAAFVAKFAMTAADGKVYPVEHFNLGVVNPVGYRVKSSEGVRFRQGSSRILEDSQAGGYALDRRRLEANAGELETALRLLRSTLACPEVTAEAGVGLADIVTRYTQTIHWLQCHDEGLLADPKGHPGGNLPTRREATAAIADLKADLKAKGQASALFGQEREGGLASILGNLDQSVVGEPAYPSPGARCRPPAVVRHPEPPVLGRQQAQRRAPVRRFPAPQRATHAGRRHPVVNDVGLAAASLPVAESRPADKDVLVRLIMNMLAGEGA